MTDNKQYDDTTMSDGYVIDQLESFDEVLRMYQKFCEAGLEPPEYYPDELDPYLDFDKLEHAWKFKNYSLIRREYVQGWIKHAEEVFGSRAYYTFMEFLNGEAHI